MLGWLHQLSYIIMNGMFSPLIYSLHALSLQLLQIRYHFLVFKLSNLQLHSLCLLTEMLSLLTFSAIVYMMVLKSTFL